MVTNITPKDITEIGLPINPVHSIDLSVCLPGIFLTGFWLLKQNPFGLFLSPAVLMFTILMNITIGSLTFFMRMKGIEADFTLTVIMIFFTLISSFLLYLLLRSFNFSKKKF